MASFQWGTGQSCYPALRFRPCGHRERSASNVKASLLGPELSVPIAGGSLALGTWQGIYLCEHRDAGGPRSLVATVWGEPAA
jgi:thiamine phosphate synthase YjbQ (UPF0047 family)